MRTVFQITTEDIIEYVKPEDVDYVVKDLEKHKDFYIKNLCVDSAKYKNYNRGDLTVGMLVKYQNDIWEVTEITFGAATIECLNTGMKVGISIGAFVEIV